MNDKLEE